MPVSSPPEPAKSRRPAILAQAPGKLLLLGEYAVLEGAPAIVTAVDRFARARISPADDDRFTVVAPVLEIAGQAFALEEGKVIFPETCPEATRRQLAFFRITLEHGLKLLAEHNLTLNAARFEIDTSEFFLENGGGVKLGFGSSAALCVALLGAMTAMVDSAASPEDDLLYLFETALAAHREAQGKVGSGADVAASVFGGVIQYQILPDTLTAPTLIEELPLPRDLNMLYIWSGQSASTTELVGRVHAFRDAQPTAWAALLERMQILAEDGCFALTEGNTPAFMQIAGQYHQAMTDLGEAAGADIISAPHRELAALAAGAGAVYKPSGAGGGDLGIAFSDDPDVITATTAAVHEAGYRTLDLTVVPRGLQTTRQED